MKNKLDDELKKQGNVKIARQRWKQRTSVGEMKEKDSERQKNREGEKRPKNREGERPKNREGEKRLTGVALGETRSVETASAADLGRRRAVY